MDSSSLTRRRRSISLLLPLWVVCCRRHSKHSLKFLIFPPLPTSRRLEHTRPVDVGHILLIAYAPIVLFHLHPFFINAQTFAFTRSTSTTFCCSISRFPCFTNNQSFLFFSFTSPVSNRASFHFLLYLLPLVPSPSDPLTKSSHKTHLHHTSFTYN